MAKKQKQQTYEVTPTDRLGMRVSAMINSPKAQDLGKVTIHRLDTDPAEAWETKSGHSERYAFQWRCSLSRPPIQP